MDCCCWKVYFDLSLLRFWLITRLDYGCLGILKEGCLGRQFGVLETLEVGAL